MQAAIVVAIALTGLGCQNKEDESNDIPPVFSSINDTEATPYPQYTSASSYSGFYPRNFSDDVSDVYPTHWDAMRATFCSFFLGRDPDVITTAEIEASVYGD
jgi:hypothetical protein